MNKHISLFGTFSSILLSSIIFAQENTNKDAYLFTTTSEIAHTPVKNQYRSGTCWSFSGLGLMEAEVLRTHGDTIDLSEMFVVRNAYTDKVKKYVRLHGHLNLAGGGGFSDVIYVIDTYGIVPEQAYSGLEIGEENHMHAEMDAVLKAYADAVIQNKNKKLSPVWLEGFNGILDAYLGDYPDSFSHASSKVNPLEYRDLIGINPENYVEITSFLHRPFYQTMIMELPDNWMWSETWNLPLDEMMEALDHALENGYTVAWGADVSEKGFSWKNGLAIIPDENLQDLSGTEKERWEKLTEKEKQKALYAFDTIVAEKEISPELRQEAYDNYETTDDHGMLIIGKAEDQAGNKYYKVKNSWGTDDHKFKGYLYASEAYVRYKTMNMMMHQDALPKTTLEKLKLK